MIKTPYPDELFYSVISRYHNWSRNRLRDESMEKLFGKKNFSPLAGFPSRLSILASRINDDMITPIYLVNHTTFFPLFRPFIQNERANRLETLMSNNVQSNQIQTTMGHIEKRKKYLYFCPKCFDEDKVGFGEAYWHRTHQVFGVNVCPKHNVWLIESTIKHSTEKLVPLSRKIVDKGKDVFNSKPNKHLYYLISTGVHWILNNHPPTLDLEDIKSHYKTILQETNFMNYQEKIRFKELIPKIIEFFGEEFLMDMESNLDPKQRSSWIRGIFKKHVKPVHPIKHLILISFLKYTPKDYFELRPTSFKPFGEGPWLCLNPAAQHYLQPVIRDCRIKGNEKTGKPGGIFHCSCGFIYTRNGPDKTQSDKYRYSYVKSFGRVWEQKLMDSRLIENKSFRKLAKEFKMDRETLSKHFNRLVIQNNSTDEFQFQKENYRKEWFNLLTKFPEKTQTELRGIANAIFKWLYRNDKEWLTLHSPIKKRSHVPNNSDASLIAKDWNITDMEIVSQIPNIVKSIALENGKPKRITATAISDRLRYKQFLSRNKHHLPKTKKCLESVIENTEQFRIRRLMWVLMKMEENNEKFAKSKILAKASLKNQQLTKEMEELIESHL
ncbi:TnsD family Tn7-like transposition protein [Neobacillus soli]|nr:TnsD family Tn7-like transposition protein [Neobacillus soli]